MNKSTNLWAVAEKYGIFIIFFIAIIVFACINPKMVHPDQLFSVLLSASWVAVGAAGMTFAICSAGMDLSVPGIMALCCSLLAKLIMDNGLSTGAAIIVMAIVAACCGILNGVLITKLKIPPFITTLATCLCFHGITQVYTGNNGTTIAAEQYACLNVLGHGFTLGVPNKIYVVILVYAILLFVYHKSAFGVKIRAIGSNETAARATGIKVDRTLIAVYVMTALTAALAAILNVATMGSSSPKAGNGFDLDCITAVVLGGSALSGGKGRLTGTLVGALLVVFVNQCLSFLSVSEAVRVIVTGLVLVLALSFSSLTSYAQRKEDSGK